MGKRTMTPERFEAIKAALSTMTLREIQKHFRVSDGTLYRYGLRKTQDMYISRSAQLPADAVDRVRELAGQGKSAVVTAKEMGISYRQVAIIRKEHGIVTGKPEKVQKKVAPKPKRNPMNTLQQWKPRSDITTLETAVTRLRQRYCPVHAEATAKKASQTPAPYTDKTLFRVGNLRNVTVEDLMRMAA
jgi:transposase